MRCSLVFASIVLLTAASAPALSDTILVDGSGGGDYLTIQEGVDAAASIGDVVLVAPGVYSDTHVFEIFGMERRVNVYFEKAVTLTSSDGPEVTIVDGGGITDYGIIAMPYDPGIPGIDPFPPIVEGLTVRNGGSWVSVGIAVIDGEARGNIVTGHYFGIISGTGHDHTGITGGGRARSNVALIAGNTCEGNEHGISVMANEDGFSSGVVSGNTVSENDVGVSIRGPSGYARLIGNEICQNATGVHINLGQSWQNGTLTAELVQNLIANNTSRNVTVYNVIWEDYWLDLLIGGTLEDANSIYGAPSNLHVTCWGFGVEVDASYNYWGSIYCPEFEPLFHVGCLPDTSFTFFPFTDESHAAVYEDCESVSATPLSWGAIKALYI